MYLGVDFVFFHSFLNTLNIDAACRSKKDSDSGVGSDNGDKRLSATEVKLEPTAFCVHLSVCPPKPFSRKRPLAHVNDLHGQFSHMCESSLEPLRGV